MKREKIRFESSEKGYPEVEMPKWMTASEEAVINFDF